MKLTFGETQVTITGVFKQLGVWIFTLVYIPLLVLVCLLTSRQRRSTMGPLMTRGWGHGALYFAGVKVRYTDEARRVLSTRAPRVLTFNHGSTLDVLVGASLLPDGGVLALKSELRKLPLLGSGAIALGSIFLDRANRENAYATLRESAQRIQDETLQVLIAPEGTRSADGELGRFKLGAFHLAHEAQVPIVPIVLHETSEIWPRVQLAPSRGTVTIDVLPELLVRSDTPESVRDTADQLREAYQLALTTSRSKT